MMRAPLIAACCFWPVDTAVGSGEDTPDPTALLRGVETARRELYGRLKVRLVTTDIAPRVDEQVSHLDMQFDGAKRLIVWRYRVFVMDTVRGRDNFKALAAVGHDPNRANQAGLGKYFDAFTSAVYDGERFINYTRDGLGNTAIQDPAKGSGIPCFDPRILGITTTHGVAYTFERCLGFSLGEKVALIGREEVDGTPVWRVRSTHPSGVSADYWVEDRDGFRVRRYTEEYDTPSLGQRKTVRSEFAASSRVPVLPNRVTVEEERRVGDAGYQLRYRQVIEVVEADYRTRPDPALLTAAGLGMPPGEMVSDDINKKVAGYWDGTGFNPDHKTAVRLARQVADDAASTARTRRWAAILAGVALVVTGAVLVWRHRRLPATPPA